MPEFAVLKALTFILLALMGIQVFAKDPELSYYVFQNKGTALYGTIVLSEDANPLKIPTTTWFNWNCTAFKQSDGVLMDCRHQDEFVETKVYCDLPQNKFGRLMRLGSGANFVTFEARCSAKIAAAKKMKPKASGIEPIARPVSPTPPTPPSAPPPEVPAAAPESAPVVAPPPAAASPAPPLPAPAGN